MPTTKRVPVGATWADGCREINLRFCGTWLLLLLAAAVPMATCQQVAPETLFRNVRVFDGKSAKLSEPTNVLVRGNRIAGVGEASGAAGARVVEGEGRTLMPGSLTPTRT